MCFAWAFFMLFIPTLENRNTMSSLLIGSEKTIEVTCKALFQSTGSKPTEVAFIAEFTRLSRSDSKKRNIKVSDFLRDIRSKGRDIMLLEHDHITLTESGKLALIESGDDESKVLTDEEKETHRLKITAELDEIGKQMDTEITNSLHNIKNLELSNKKIAQYSPELLAEMLENEPYYLALREGLRKSNGVFEEKRTKN